LIHSLLNCLDVNSGIVLANNRYLSVSCAEGKDCDDHEQQNDASAYHDNSPPIQVYLATVKVPLPFRQKVKIRRQPLRRLYINLYNCQAEEDAPT
jgi:hypothetical protein